MVRSRHAWSLTRSARPATAQIVNHPHPRLPAVTHARMAGGIAARLAPFALPVALLPVARAIVDAMHPDNDAKRRIARRSPTPLPAREEATMPKLDLTKVPVKTGSIYPEPYASMMKGRSSLRLGDAGGLTQFGANLVMLEPGAMSSLRHWHMAEDEFVMVIEGECVLVQDEGETRMRAGDCAAFPAGSPNGHHFINRSGQVARFLVVGSKARREVATYSDVDLKVEMEGGRARFTYKDGTDWTGPR